MPDSPDDTATWLFDAVVRYLQGPLYTTPLMGFIDVKCLSFEDDGTGANKLAWTIVHNEFKELVDNLLCDFLSDIGVTPTRFVDVVEQANGEKKLGDFVATSILTVDDFNQFKAMMVRRNLDLTFEVIEQGSDVQAVMDSGVSSESTKETGNGGDAVGDSNGDDAIIGDDSSVPEPLVTGANVAFEKALKMSSLQFEKDQRRIEDSIGFLKPKEAGADVALEEALKMSEAQFEADQMLAMEKSNKLLQEKTLEARAMEESQKQTETVQPTQSPMKMPKKTGPLSEFEEEEVKDVNSVDDRASSLEESTPKEETSQTVIDDGFDDGAIEQAIAMSEKQFKLEQAAFAAEETAVLVDIAEKKRAAEETKRVRLKKERILREAQEKERAMKEAIEKEEQERLQTLELDTKTAIDLSISAAAEMAAALERERLELEQALALSLAGEAKCVAALEEAKKDVDAPEETEDKEEEEQRELDEEHSSVGVVDRLAKAPLGVVAAPPVASGKLTSLAALPPLRAVNSVGAGYKSAGYKSFKQGSAETSAPVPLAGSTYSAQQPSVSPRAVREAAVQAARAQKALVLEKQLELKKRADAAAARAALAAEEASALAQEAACLDDAETLERKRLFVQEQRGLLVARKAKEREGELALFAARQENSLTGSNAGFQKSTSLADGKENVSRPVLSEQEQKEKRELLRMELAKRMKSVIVNRNAWGEGETYV